MYPFVSVLWQARSKGHLICNVYRNKPFSILRGGSPSSHTCETTRETTRERRAKRSGGEESGTSAPKREPARTLEFNKTIDQVLLGLRKNKIAEISFCGIRSSRIWLYDRLVDLKFYNVTGRKRKNHKSPTKPDCLTHADPSHKRIKCQRDYVTQIVQMYQILRIPKTVQLVIMENVFYRPVHSRNLLWRRETTQFTFKGSFQ